MCGLFTFSYSCAHKDFFFFFREQDYYLLQLSKYKHENSTLETRYSSATCYHLQSILRVSTLYTICRLSGVILYICMMIVSIEKKRRKKKKDKIIFLWVIYSNWEYYIGREFHVGERNVFFYLVHPRGCTDELTSYTI